jgi:hypothetical protein
MENGDAYVHQAILPLLHKHAPGLIHGMLTVSYAVTPCKIRSYMLVEVS